MSLDADQLYRLLPAVHRIRDADRGYPLRQLMEVVATQVAVLEDELERLYENQFVETAERWALPYLGELLGVTGLPLAGLAHSPRAEVGHTLASRRRKGTASVLELVARDTTGWHARAVEFFERLETTQHLNHRRPHSLATAGLRQASRLEFLPGPFEPVTRLAEVRRLESGRGRWNIPNVGVALWRILPVSHTAAPLLSAPELNDRRHFRFHPLNLDAPLFNLPLTETDAGALAGPDHVPLPITHRRLAGTAWSGGAAGDPPQFHPATSLYGEGRSLVLYERIGTVFVPVPPERIVVADLRDATDGSGNPIWAHDAFALARDLILLDPVRGRVLYPGFQLPGSTPRGSCHFGRALRFGGGEYGRAASMETLSGTRLAIRNEMPVSNLLATSLASVPSAESVILEIGNSGRYTEPSLQIDATDRSVEMVAVDGAGPVVPLGSVLEITGNASGAVTLSGVVFCQHGILVRGPLRRLTLRHCTLIPKGPLRPDGGDAFDGQPALVVTAPGVEVVIEDSILGPARLADDTRLILRRSLLCAGIPANAALCAADGLSPAGTLRIEASTIIGKIAAHDFELVSNSILFARRETSPPDGWPAPVWTPRRQTGCFRFTWIPADSVVPRRHQCLPDALHPEMDPAFASLLPAHPGFGQLSRLCPLPIRTGASDGAAMGVGHELFEPQRESHLRARLAEYLRFGLETGATFES